MASWSDTARVVRALARSRALRRELLAYFSYVSVEWGAWIAILVYAYGRGGASAAGAVALVQLVPAIFVAPFGSILGDRIRRDRALGIGYLAQAAALGAVAVAMTVAAPVWMIYGAAAVATCAITLTRPVHHAILPMLAETPQELTGANAISSTLEGLAVFTGPVATGILLQLTGEGTVFAVLACAQFGAFLLTFHLPMHVLPAEEAATTTSPVAEALAGFHAMRAEPSAALLTGLVGAQQVVVGMFEVLVVGLALDAYGMGPAGPGLLTAGDGIGVLLGSLAAVVLIGRKRLSPAIGFGILLTGIPLVLVGVAPVALLALILFGCSGFGKAFFDVASRTLLQRTVDDDVLARVFGLEEAVSTAGLALGAALTPVLSNAFGPRGAFVAAGLFLPVLGLLVWRPIRRLDQHAHVPTAELARLEAIDLFEPLSAPVVERLAWHLIPFEARSGEIVIREGDHGDRFYIITEGRAEATVGGTIVGTLGVGDYFGEIALLRDVPRTATVTAVEDLRLVTLDRAEFIAAITGSPLSTAAADRSADRRLDEHPD